MEKINKGFQYAPFCILLVYNLITGFPAASTVALIVSTALLVYFDWKEGVSIKESDKLKKYFEEKLTKQAMLQEDLLKRVEGLTNNVSDIQTKAALNAQKEQPRVRSF